MATCKICGKEDGSLPDWPNWDCFRCFVEQVNADRHEKNYEVIALQLDVMRMARDKLNIEILDRELEIAWQRAQNKVQ